jgi:hypothetical protein
MESELMSAKKTMRETHEKYDETSRRVGIKEQKLERALASADQAEKRVEDLEDSLGQVARQMGDKESSREKVGKREFIPLADLLCRFPLTTFSKKNQIFFFFF